MTDAQADGGKGPVVVGVDGSAEALDAIALGDSLASVLESTVLLTFVHPFEQAAKKMSSSEYDQLVKEVANATLEGLPVEGPGSKPRQMRVIGGSSPGNGLHSLAAAEHASFLVVGSSNRGGRGRVTPGGVGEPLLAGSPCPVAVAPRGYATDPSPIVPSVSHMTQDRSHIWHCNGPSGSRRGSQRNCVSSPCTLAWRLGISPLEAPAKCLLSMRHSTRTCARTLRAPLRTSGLGGHPALARRRCGLGAGAGKRGTRTPGDRLPRLRTRLDGAAGQRRERCHPWL